MVEKFLKFVASLQDLCDCAAGLPCKPEEIFKVTHWVESVPDEEAGYALFQLADARWGYYTEWQDYTGHG